VRTVEATREPPRSPVGALEATGERVEPTT
jgi:hypothetical protein